MNNAKLQIVESKGVGNDQFVPCAYAGIGIALPPPGGLGAAGGTPGINPGYTGGGPNP